MRRFVANGFEITAQEDEIVCIDRKTWGLHWLMIVMGLVAAFVIVFVALAAVGVEELQTDLGREVLVAVPVLLVILIGVSYRTYQRRREQPSEEIEDTLIIDRSAQVVRNRKNEIVAQLPEVQVRMRTDWRTRGMMRVVVLGWPSGHRTIFRTFGRQRCLELLKFLNEWELDAK